jgi:hypothetical protein
MCWVVQDVRTCLIWHTKEPGKWVWWQDVRLLRFYFSQQKYFGTINFCWISQDVGKTQVSDCASSTVLPQILLIQSTIASQFNSDFTRPTCLVGFFCAQSVKQQFAVRHVAPLWHIILILNQQVFALTPYVVFLAEKQLITSHVIQWNLHNLTPEFFRHPVIFNKNLWSQSISVD